MYQACGAQQPLLLSVFITLHYCLVWQTFFFYSDPDFPFVPSAVPFGNHVLSDHEEMEIQCRVSDPSANVTLINVDTQQPVPCVYDSKRGALGIFTAGTYICKALIKGEERYSSEYIVHGWTGACSHMRESMILCSKSLTSLKMTYSAFQMWSVNMLYLVVLYPDTVSLYLRCGCSTCWANSQADGSTGGRHHHGHLCGSGIWDSGRPLEISWQAGENTKWSYAA